MARKADVKINFDKRMLNKRHMTHADKVLSAARSNLLFVQELLMRRRRRMDDKCFCIPNVRQIACQPQAVDDVSADPCVTTLNAKV